MTATGERHRRRRLRAAMAVPVSDPVTAVGHLVRVTVRGAMPGPPGSLRRVGLGLLRVGAASSGGSVPSLGVVAFVSASASPDVGDSVFDESSVTLGRNGLRARESVPHPSRRLLTRLSAMTENPCLATIPHRRQRHLRLPALPPKLPPPVRLPPARLDSGRPFFSRCRSARSVTVHSSRGRFQCTNTQFWQTL